MAGRTIKRDALIFALCTAADAVTKQAAIARGIASLNDGAAFSFAAGLPWGGLIFSALGCAALAAVAYLLPRRTRSPGLAIMAAGIVGNAVDRVARGAVVDWIDMVGLKWNLADIALCAGAAIIALSLAVRELRR